MMYAKSIPFIVLFVVLGAFVVGTIIWTVPEPDHTDIIIRLDHIIDRLDDIQHQINQPTSKQPMGWYGT